MTGDSPLMADVRRRLRAIGLPDTLFDASFPQQCVEAADRYERLSAKAAEMVKDEQWKEAAAGMPSHTPSGLEFLSLVQGRTTHWSRRLKEAHRFYRCDGTRPYRILKAIKAGHRPPGYSTKEAAALEAAGHSVAKLWQDWEERNKPS